MEDHRIAPEIEPILVALMMGRMKLALVMLQQYFRKRQGRISAYKTEITKLKTEFNKVSGMNAYPMDFTEEDRVYWDDILRDYIEAVGLDVLVEDIHASGKGKWNLLYFMSADKGKRSSRWDMFVIRRHEQEREKESQEYAKAAKTVMKRLLEILGEKEAMGRMVQDWVMRLKKERDMLIKELANIKGKPGRQDEIAQRLKTIRVQVGKWERGDL